MKLFAIRTISGLVDYDRTVSAWLTFSEYNKQGDSNVRI